jgi:hypothetical protein
MANGKMKNINSDKGTSINGAVPQHEESLLSEFHERSTTPLSSSQQTNTSSTLAVRHMFRVGHKRLHNHAAGQLNIEHRVTNSR